MNSTRSNNPSISRRTKLVKSVVKLSLMSIPILMPCLDGYAQQPEQTDNQLKMDISTLKNDINALEDAQRKIIDQLDELKRLLPANTRTQTVPQASPSLLPSRLNIRGEGYRGESSARLAIIEYSDFECPYCGQYERNTSPQVLENYIKTGKVKLFYRDLPLPMHLHAISATRAAHCAGEQGKYWKMHDSLFANQTALSDPALLDRAKTLGLDASRFNECFSSDKYSGELRKGMAEAQGLGIDGTPTFYIGTIDPSGDVVNISKRIVGAHPYEVFQSALDEVLAAKS
jgi:protein-disulfide isomerase